MSYEINGYLGNQIEEIKKENYTNHQYIFKQCEEINRFAQKIKYDFNINSEDNQGIIATILYMKIHNAFQGAVIMYQYGLDTEAKTLVRSALEAMFVLKAVIKDEKNIELLKQDNFKQKEKRYKSILEDKHNIFSEIKGNIDLEQYEELKRKNKKEDIKDVHISRWAELSDSLADYYYAYKVLCSDVHVDIGNFDKYIVANEDGQVEQFNAIPNTDDIERVLFTGIYALLTAIDHMNHLRTLGIEEEIKKFEIVLHNFKDTVIKES